MPSKDIAPKERALLEAQCQRRVIANLIKIGRQIGPRTRMVQLVAERGVVDAVLSLTKEETSGWNDLYLAGLLSLSLEATIVESIAFRRLFTQAELGTMELELRDSGYDPRPPG